MGRVLTGRHRSPYHGFSVEFAQHREYTVGDDTIEIMADSRKLRQSMLNLVLNAMEASAAKPGKDTGLLASAVAAPGAGKPAVEKAGKLSIAANAAGQLAYETNKAAATAGPVTVEMPNMSGVGHNLALETGEGGATPKGTKIGATPIISKGVAKVNVTLKPGTYTFFCEVPGHRPAGMYGTLTVK